MAATKVSINCESKTLVVKFDGQDKEHNYPFVWLRDNCQCEQCYHPESKQRLLNITDLNINEIPKDVEVNLDNNVILKWNDDHESKYTEDWLRSLSFDNAENKEKCLNFFQKKPKLWGNELQDQIPRVKYNELLTSDHELYKWIVTLEETGLTLVTGAPREVGIVNKIADKVAFLVKTNFGETFTVKSKERPTNLAFSARGLGLHTDLAYYHYTPGMQMLHCISQVETEGGETEFTDGFYAAKLLKQEHPELYHVLANTKVDYFNVGTMDYSFHNLSMLPIIQENSDGEVEKITYSPTLRGYHTSLTVEQVQLFYEALITFEKLMNSKRCLITYKLNNGDIACFHNYRIIHGRQGYTVTGDGERHLDGGYINWDELKSRRRVLQRQLNLN